jgi:hypothetical protein
MHQTNHRGHNETSTATTQNQLAYKACRRWRKLSAHPNAVKHIGVQHINEYGRHIRPLSACCCHLPPCDRQVWMVLAHAIVAHSWEPRLLRWRCRVAPRSKSGVSGTDGRLSLGTWTFRRPPWLRVAHPPWSASPPRQKDRYAAVRYRYQPSGPPLSMIRRRFWRSRTPMTDHARAESLGALSHSATPLRDQRGSRIRRPCNTEVREGDAESDAQSSTTVPTVGSTLPSSSST